MEQPSHHVWKHDFKEALVSIYFTPNSVITALTQKGETAAPPTKWILSPVSGSILWNGPMDKGMLIADDPIPVMLIQSEENKLHLVASSYDNGSGMWQQQITENLIYAGSDRSGNSVFIVTTSESSTGTGKLAVLTSFSMATGEERFRTPLGSIPSFNYTPNDIVHISDKVLYFAYGGIIAAVSDKDGTLLWRQEKQSTHSENWLPLNLWHPTDDGVLFCSGHRLNAFSGQTGVIWQADLGAERYPRTIKLTPWGILISYWLSEGTGVLLVDEKSGNIVWHKDYVVNKKEVWSPKGICVHNDSVLYSADGKLISLRIDSGTEQFLKELDVKEEEYQDFVLLLETNEGAVLVGNRSIRAHSGISGELAWSIMGFETPYASWNRYMAFATHFSAGAQMGMDTAFGTDGGSLGMYPWVRTYTVTRLDPNANLNVPVVTRESNLRRELEAMADHAMGSANRSLNQVGIGSSTKPGLGRGGSNPTRFASFMNSLQGVVAVKFKGNLAVVNLKNGSTTFYPIFPSVQCSPYAISDSSIRWIVELYEPVGFFCENTVIDVFRVAPPEMQ